MGIFLWETEVFEWAKLVIQQIFCTYHASNELPKVGLRLARGHAYIRLDAVKQLTPSGILQEHVLCGVLPTVACADDTMGAGVVFTMAGCVNLH